MKQNKKRFILEHEEEKTEEIYKNIFYISLIIMFISFIVQILHLTDNI